MLLRFALSIALLSPALAFAAPAKPQLEKNPTEAAMQKLVTLGDDLEKGRVPSKDDFREDLAISKNGEEVKLESIAPAPADQL